MKINKKFTLYALLIILIVSVLIITSIEKSNENQIKKNEYLYYVLKNNKTNNELKIKVPSCHKEDYHMDDYLTLVGHWILSENSAILSCSKKHQNPGNIIIKSIKNKPLDSILTRAFKKINDGNQEYEKYYSKTSNSIYYQFLNSDKNNVVAVYIKPEDLNKSENLRIVIFYSKINDDFEYSIIVPNIPVNIENLKLVNQQAFEYIQSLIIK